MPLIIPQFDLSQDDKFIKLQMRLPYVKVSKSEFSIMNYSFSFYLKPYLLQLTFKEQLKESEQPAKAIYDAEKYTLEVFLEKLVHGEDFTNLNMISLLLNKKKQKQENKKNKTKLIQVIESVQNEEVGNDDDTQPIIHQVNLKLQYGFNNQYFDIFDDLDEELLELAILDPKIVPYEERLIMNVSHIKQEFDIDAYLFDLLENEEVDNILEYQQIDNKTEFTFTNAEIAQLAQLPKKEFIINDETQILYGLVDILYAYQYEFNIMQGEFCPESATTINRLSSLFNCFQVENTLKKVIINCYQRSVCFPLIRSFELCVKAHHIVSSLLKNKVKMIKIFLELEKLFKANKPRHLLNNIFIEDYLIYIQLTSQQTFDQLSIELADILVEKSQLDIDVIKVEQEGIVKALQQEEGNNE